MNKYINLINWSDQILMEIVNICWILLLALLHIADIYQAVIPHTQQSKTYFNLSRIENTIADHI